MSRLTDSYYRILDLSPGASKQEIKAAYNRLVKQHHPDVTTNTNKHEAAAKFKLIHEAREKLLGLNEEKPEETQETGQQSGSASQNHYTADYEEFRKKQDEWVKRGKKAYEEEEHRNNQYKYTKKEYDEFRKKQEEYMKQQQKMHEEMERQEKEKKRSEEVWEAHRAKYSKQEPRKSDWYEIFSSLLYLAGAYLILCQLKFIKNLFFPGHRGGGEFIYAPPSVKDALENRSVWLRAQYWGVEYSTYDREFITYANYDGTNHSKFVKYGNEDSKKYKCHTCQERMTSMDLVKNHVEKYNPNGPQSGPD